MTWHSLNDCISIPFPFRSFTWDREVLLAFFQRGRWENKCLGQHHTVRQSRKLKSFCLSPTFWSFTALSASETRLLWLHFLLPCCYLFLPWKEPCHCISLGHPHHVPVPVPSATAQRDPAEQELSPVISWEMPATYNSIIGSQATPSELTLIPLQPSAEEFRERRSIRVGGGERWGILSLTI